MEQTHKLNEQSVTKSYFQYLIPSLIGMALMSINIVVDGIFVGHGVGSFALAGVNLAVPIYSVILSIALLIGVGGGTVFSIAVGANKINEAKLIFTLSTIFVTVITVVVSLLSFIFMEQLAFLFGANEDTVQYVLDYMTVLLAFSLFMVWETSLSVFVRNDGNPNLAMIGLVVTSILNIGLNYWMIFVLKLGVTGAALATGISIVIGLIILLTHFLKKDKVLAFVKPSFNWRIIKQFHIIGFPSFLAEAGMGIFIIGYNIAIAYHAGTNGLAAFSVINYLHTFMFLVFIGIGSSIQPMISYFYGAKAFDKIKEVVKIAEKTALLLGTIFLLIGIFGAQYLVVLFGVTSTDIAVLATVGIKIFFISYLFMGFNSIYMTYFQAIGYVKPSLWITIFRGFIVLVFMLLLLPFLFGTTGVWLALPVTEAIIAITLLLFARQGVVGNKLEVRVNENHK